MELLRSSGLWRLLPFAIVIAGCGEGGCASEVDPAEIRVLCAFEGDEVGEDNHALCNDSSMCNGIEWCDPDHPFKDSRNCVVTNPCDTFSLNRTLNPREIVRQCHEPTEGVIGAPFRTCRVAECDEKACYDPVTGLTYKGDQLVTPPQASSGTLEHVDGFMYDIGCLRAVCTQAICASDTPCDDDQFCNGLEFCEPGIGCRAESLPCEDLAPKGEEGFYRCNEEEDRCDWICQDEDGDGFGQISCGGNDCDDTDPNRYPGNTEICDDGHDEDCDLNTVGNLDADRDGYIDSSCRNVTDEGESAGLDCDDGAAGVHGAQNEVCNGIDDDCDGDVDEDVQVERFVDEDGDGFGVGDPMLGCPGEPGFSVVSGDCDDTNPRIVPGAIVCGEPFFDAQQRQIWPYDLCQVDGMWGSGACEEECFTQPDGTGICH